MSKKAYLYTRVSKQEQASLGQGLKRQRELAEDFLKSYPEYEIHHVYEDAGKSAFYAKNLDEDAGLGGFISAAENGDIEPDSLLVLESICRLSRIGTRKGSKLLNRIFDCKINIAVVKFNTIFYWAQENDLNECIMLSSGLYLGHLESEQKSQRIKKTMDMKLEQARKGKAKFKPRAHPAWLMYNKQSGEHDLIPENVKVVRMIFELYLNKRMRCSRIAKHLNDRKIRPITRSKQWTYDSVLKQLQNEAVIGEYQPKRKIIKDGKAKLENNGSALKHYYPAIISIADYESAQTLFLENRENHRQGSVSKFKNLFRHIGTCLLCGSSMILKEGHLRCNNAPVKCTNKNVRYTDVENAITDFFQSASFLTFLVSSNEDVSLEASLNAELQPLLRAMKNYRFAIESVIDEEVIARFRRRIDELTQQVLEIEEQLSTFQSEREKQIQSADLSDEVMRERYNALLIEHVEYIKFYGDYISVKLKDEDCESIKHSSLPTIKATRSLSSMPAAGSDKDRSSFDFIETLKADEDIHKARFIYQRQLKEGLSRKQTMRIFREQKVKISAEDHRRLRAEIGIEYREDKAK
ncbi:MAG: recombinase family protein [Neptuniibacter sp.]